MSAARQYLVASEGGHLRGAAIGVGRIDPDPDRLGKRFRSAAPEPGRCRKIGKASAASRIGAVAGRAIVAEQRATRLTHDRHQLRIGLNAAEAFGLDALRPGAALELGLFKALCDRRTLIDTKQPLRIGHARSAMLASKSNNRRRKDAVAIRKK